MTETIIDKSDFFRRRFKPTDKEWDERTAYLFKQCWENFDYFLLTDRFSPEQRARLMTRINDFVFSEIRREENHNDLNESGN